MPQTPVEFFLVALPGLEDLVASEIKEWSPHLNCQTEHGGVTVHAPLSEGLALNLVLKTPTRILLRVDSFMCRDFPKLFRNMLELEWQKWLDPSVQLEVQAASARSRLKIKKRIEETCVEAWQKRQQQKRTVVGPNKVTLYVRLADNRCTFSLDTSGERLHKRGQRQFIGLAPLRESIAAALLQMMGRGVPAERSVELLDPMVGSGTFLLEAAIRDQALQQRDFAFTHFATKEITPPVLAAARPRIERLVGFEQDAKTLAACRHNLADVAAEIQQQDFFTAAALPPKTTDERWVINNPPYGERLKVDGPLPEYYARLFTAVEKVAHPDRACFLLPAAAAKGRLLLPVSWKVLEKRRFLNGGISVIAFLFGRK